jgi:hypothetical protein
LRDIPEFRPCTWAAISWSWIEISSMFLEFLYSSWFLLCLMRRAQTRGNIFRYYPKSLVLSIDVTNLCRCDEVLSSLETEMSSEMIAQMWWFKIIPNIFRWGKVFTKFFSCLRPKSASVGAR